MLTFPPITAPVDRPEIIRRPARPFPALPSGDFPPALPPVHAAANPLYSPSPLFSPNYSPPPHSHGEFSSPPAPHVNSLFLPLALPGPPGPPFQPQQSKHFSPFLASPAPVQPLSHSSSSVFDYSSLLSSSSFGHNQIALNSPASRRSKPKFPLTDRPTNRVSAAYLTNFRVPKQYRNKVAAFVDEFSSSTAALLVELHASAASIEKSLRAEMPEMGKITVGQLEKWLFEGDLGPELAEALQRRSANSALNRLNLHPAVPVRALEAEPEGNFLVDLAAHPRSLVKVAEKARVSELRNLPSRPNRPDRPVAYLAPTLSHAIKSVQPNFLDQPSGDSPKLDGPRARNSNTENNLAIWRLEKQKESRMRQEQAEKRQLLEEKRRRAVAGQRKLPELSSRMARKEGEGRADSEG